MNHHGLHTQSRGYVYSTPQPPPAAAARSKGQAASLLRCASLPTRLPSRPSPLALSVAEDSGAVAHHDPAAAAAAAAAERRDVW